MLQTLALMQKRADEPREVAAPRPAPGARAARVAERGRAREPRATLAAALEAAVAEVEDDHGVPVDVVAVGDAALDEHAEALVAATREAVRQRREVRRRGAGERLRRGGGRPLEVFVRDRGPGFDPAAVPADRRGLRESVLGRMERHGGRAACTPRPGAGTEVELVLPR